jgi:hypothetical protein
MNDVYRDELRVMQNLFLPCVKLVAKCTGPRLTREVVPV